MKVQETKGKNDRFAATQGRGWPIAWPETGSPSTETII